MAEHREILKDRKPGIKERLGASFLAMGPCLRRYGAVLQKGGQSFEELPSPKAQEEAGMKSSG